MAINNNNLPTFSNTVDETPLNKNMSDLTQALIDAKTVDETKSIIDMFNLAIAKKDALRTVKLGELEDEVLLQMIKRFKNHPDNLSHKDLIEYLNTIENTLSKTTGRIKESQENPAITFAPVTNNTQIDINVGQTLSREQRENVADAVKAFMAELQANQNSLVDNSEKPVIISTDDYEEVNTETFKFKDDEDENNINGEELKDENNSN